jgi:hypothetical protein
MYEIKAEVVRHHTYDAKHTRIELFDVDRHLALTIIATKEDAVNWPEGSGLIITLGASLSKPKKTRGETET